MMIHTTIAAIGREKCNKINYLAGGAPALANA